VRRISWNARSKAARWLAVALVGAAAPALAHGWERLEHIEEIALRAEDAGGAVHRIQIEAAAVKYDKEAGVFHVRLATADERVLAAMKVVPRGAYLARTPDGYQFRIRREDVTLHELEVVEGCELVHDLQVPAPRALAGALMHGLVAVCELRAVTGPDGPVMRETVEQYQTSVTEPLEGRVTTRVLRVALDSVTLQDAVTGRIYHRVDARPLVSSTAGVEAAGR
jgi:hypothetical protein